MQYTVLVTSVTGIKGKQLTEGNTYPAAAFIEEHIPELVEAKVIELAVPATTPESITLTKKYLKEHPELVAEGYKEGDTYPKPAEA